MGTTGSMGNHAWAIEPPVQPAAPDFAPENIEVVPFRGCRRDYTYQGKTLQADSYYRRDCENLRPLLTHVPDAVAELNSYQDGRRRLDSTVYIASVGIAMLVVGLFSSSFFEGETENMIRRVGILGGLTLAGGTAAYAFIRLRANESHIGSAVEKYNQAYPEKKIELQFSAEGLF